MSFARTFGISCSAAAMIAVVALAQPGDKPKPADKPAERPAEKPAEKPGAAMPDAKAMAEMMDKVAKPGKMHERLAARCGVWEGEVKMWMDPAAPPTDSVCTTSMVAAMGGRFVRAETVGSFDMGTGEAKRFEGFGIYGYNNTTQKFESTWADNFGTMMMHFTGTLSDDGKTLTWNSRFVDPMTNQESWMREVDTSDGPDNSTLEMFAPTADGKEMKVMEIKYTRKKGAGPQNWDAKPPAKAPAPK